MRPRQLSFLLFFTSITFFAHAQKKNQHEAQYWLGYMTSVRVSPKISIWNDLHVVPESFFIARHGISYHLHKSAVVTGGYAWLYLTTPNSTNLTRKEHRPWAQIVATMPLDEKWQVQNRVRYDARFREKIMNGDVADGYTFNNRLRYMVSVRRNIKSSIGGDGKKFIAINNEVLLNFGKNITGNNLDQYRASAFFGVVKPKATFQLGYMYRFVPPANTTGIYKHNHTATIWITQNFTTKKYKVQPQGL